jgi:nucleotidyltransferase/DNA polymerase involved in DNA repair
VQDYIDLIDQARFPKGPDQLLFSTQERNEFDLHIKNLLSQPMDLDTYCMHIRINSFYISAALRNHPELTSKPVAIGDFADTLICDCNSVAERFGIDVTMDAAMAASLCPDLTILPTDLESYKRISQQFFNILREYDESPQLLGSDEAILNLTQYFSNQKINSHPQTLQFIENLKKKTHSILGLTLTCGISHNPL